MPEPLSDLVDPEADGRPPGASAQATRGTSKRADRAVSVVICRKASNTGMAMAIPVVGVALGDVLLDETLTWNQPCSGVGVQAQAARALGPMIR